MRNSPHVRICGRQGRATSRPGIPCGDARAVPQLGGWISGQRTRSALNLRTAPRHSRSRCSGASAAVLGRCGRRRRCAGIERFVRRGYSSFKLRPGPPEPNRLTLPPLHPAVNLRADKPPTQAYRLESRPTARPLPHSDYLRVATSPHHAPNHPSPPGGARAGANSGTSPESPSDRSTR